MGVTALFGIATEKFATFGSNFAASMTALGQELK
jgi:hypothetical protein